MRSEPSPHSANTRRAFLAGILVALALGALAMWLL